MKVIDWMRAEPLCVSPEDRLADAARAMWEGDCGAVPVVDGQRHVIGMVTDRDACMAAWSRGQSLSDIQVQDAMARRVFSVWADDSIEVAVDLMHEKRLRRLPVVDSEERLVGILSLSDLAIGTWSGKSRDLKPAAIGGLLAAISTPHGQRLEQGAVIEARGDRVGAAKPSAPAAASSVA